MAKIQFINEFAPDETFTYDKRVRLLKQRKLRQTQEKIACEGGLDEDDYGRVVPPADFHFDFIPTHENGSFYGYKGWTLNYTRLLEALPLYCDPLDSFVGRGFFFITRAKGEIWNPDYPYPELQREFRRYHIICGIGSDGHFTPDLHMGLQLGWGGILEKLKKYRAVNTAPECQEFYDSEQKIVEAIIRFLNRMASGIEALSRQERNPYLRKNLEQMARVNRKISDRKPDTMREAIQWMCWFSFFARLYNRGPSGGQLDELLRPYYEADMAAGRITEEEAKFDIVCLLLNDSRYYQLGGPDENGNDMTSHMSYLILDAADWINIPCNLTVRVHDRSDEGLIRKGVEYLFQNKTGRLPLDEHSGHGIHPQRSGQNQRRQGVRGRLL